MFAMGGRIRATGRSRLITLSAPYAGCFEDAVLRRRQPHGEQQKRRNTSKPVHGPTKRATWSIVNFEISPFLIPSVTNL